MKLSVAIAGSDALPSAFVVFRGFEESMGKAAELGYDGVELALKNTREIDWKEMSRWLVKNNLEVSCISTGQVYADTGLMFTDKDPDKRLKLKQTFCEMIDVAADFGRLVNIGRVRGQKGDDPNAEERFIDMARDLCQYADEKNVTLILEPVNRYEIDFINNVEEGAELLRKLNVPNMKLMPDTFHMNIEDRFIGDTLAKYISDVAYIHFADSNRLAPGQGHTNFENIFNCLQSVKYQGWVSLEILPKPDPETAAYLGAEFLIPRIRKYNLTLNESYHGL